MDVLYRGAEATIYRDQDLVIKKRIRKGYRLPELDEKIRRSRTRKEAQIMIKALRSGVNVPRIFDSRDFEITMEFIPGHRMKEALGITHYREIGELVADLHNAGIMHGDLTTSNMIWSGKLYLIDFGLAKTSHKIEDQAVDLFLLYESLKAGHFPVLERAWKGILKAYKKKYSKAKQVVNRIEHIKRRRRYK